MTPHPSAPKDLAPHAIGTPGVPWGAAERTAWLSRQRVQRSYQDEVVERLRAWVPAAGELFEYGVLDYGRLGLDRYPLFGVRSRAWRDGVPTVLVTGGVHGYETSGVQGALLWLREELGVVSEHANVLLLPCLSPWGYETVNRWNPDALDPNRQFKADSPAAEAALAMACVASQARQVDLHVDLHETTDTDNSEFGPAKAARDGTVFEWEPVPDGFYLVGDVERDTPAFQKALIDAVAKVTHIAAADERGNIIGEPLQQPGVINYAVRALGLCAGISAAPLVTTTEVYPDSPRTTPDACNRAQVVAVSAAVEYLRAHAMRP